MLYLVWYDADTRRPAAERMQDAIAAYARRFHASPNLVLVSANETVEMEGVAVRSVRTVQPNHFWVGHSDDPSQAHSIEEAQVEELPHG
ncbi:hypothetical protein K2Z83_13055 [Oscillochloris sp. ZM17-4]|uniref:hypothetical protein n=1 Tax=Oscillochloris sp. ZM17-4 TaxID=2866714 RepID=UPI001C739650|nr:hypothetical protein [Oscillochloris sp. ZM17-4]MBX0328607.1 hypothetical protein [Oscillochloris sp. ZM17-4]